MIKDLRTNYEPIDSFTMANIADYMDDDIREQIHFDLAPCTCEQFIAEYAYRIGGDREEDFAYFLADDMNLDLDDIIFTAYCERYDSKKITDGEFDWLVNDCPYVMRVTPLCGVSLENGVAAYVVMMLSGDIVVYA